MGNEKSCENCEKLNLNKEIVCGKDGIYCLEKPKPISETKSLESIIQCIIDSMLNRTYISMPEIKQEAIKSIQDWHIRNGGK